MGLVVFYALRISFPLKPLRYFYSQYPTLLPTGALMIFIRRKMKVHYKKENECNRISFPLKPLRYFYSQYPTLLPTGALITSFRR